MKIRVNNIELEDWEYNSAAEPVRYRYEIICDTINIIREVVIRREYINDDPIYHWAWFPYFSHDLEYLNDVFVKEYGSYIRGTTEHAMSELDRFLTRH